MIRLYIILQIQSLFLKKYLTWTWKIKRFILNQQQNIIIYKLYRTCYNIN